MTGLSRGMPSAASSPGRTGTRCAAVPTPSRPSSTAFAPPHERSCGAVPTGTSVRSIRAGAPPSPAAIEHLAAEHADTLGADGRTAAVTALLDQLVGHGAARPSRRGRLGHRPPRQRRWHRLGRPRGRCRGGGDCTCLGATSVRWRCAWPGSPVDGSTTPSRGSTGCCREGCACTRCCRPSRTAVRISACASRASGREGVDDPRRAGSGLAGNGRGAARPRRRPGVARRQRRDGGRARRPSCRPSSPSATPQERLVVVEDVRELDPRHPHVVRLQGRSPNVEGRGAVTLVDLVRQALRMRPDRLVVGEVRGAEVRELLAALNTGHEGGMSTVHANGPEEVPARIEALAALAGMPRAAVHAQLRGSLQAVVHVEPPRGSAARGAGRGLRPRSRGPGNGASRRGPRQWRRRVSGRARGSSLSSTSSRMLRSLRRDVGC